MRIRVSTVFENEIYLALSIGCSILRTRTYPMFRYVVRKPTGMLETQAPGFSSYFRSSTGMFLNDAGELCG
jgi:hypothetical protein